jgi:hypothetical protein
MFSTAFARSARINKGRRNATPSIG